MFSKMEEEVILKKLRHKGRPRKVITEEEVVKSPKKRGRKKKIIDEPVEPKRKLKRGRKPAVKFFSSSIRKKMPLTITLDDPDKYIVHLDIKESNEVDKFEKDKFESFYTNNNLSEVEKVLIEFNDMDINLNEDNIIELYEKRLELRNDQDLKSINEIKNKEFSTIKIPDPVINNVIDKMTLMESFVENNDWLHNTDICCWWCCHEFDTLPLGLPIKYKNKKYLIKGIFCSFNCLTAYNNIYKLTPKHLINQLYKDVTGTIIIPNKSLYRDFLNKQLDINLFNNNEIHKTNYINSLIKLTTDKLIPAPPKELLKKFGGVLTIDEYRQSFNGDIIFNIISYPFTMNSSFCNKVNINNVKNANIKVFDTIKVLENSTRILDDQNINETKNRVDKIESKKKNTISNFVQFT